MLANGILAILIVLMIIRDGQLAARYRRPFRVAFLAFWVVLLVAHWTSRPVLYPVVAICLVMALALKIREVSQLTKILKDSGVVSPVLGAPSLWDREIDGYWAGKS